LFKYTDLGFSILTFLGFDLTLFNIHMLAGIAGIIGRLITLGALPVDLDDLFFSDRDWETPPYVNRAPFPPHETVPYPPQGTASVSVPTSAPASAPGTSDPGASTPAVNNAASQGVAGQSNLADNSPSVDDTPYNPDGSNQPNATYLANKLENMRVRRIFLNRMQLTPSKDAFLEKFVKQHHPDTYVKAYVNRLTGIPSYSDIKNNKTFINSLRNIR
jgi:hypothetical protein